MCTSDAVKVPASHDADVDASALHSFRGPREPVTKISQHCGSMQVSPEGEAGMTGHLVVSSLTMYSVYLRVHVYDATGKPSST